MQVWSELSVTFFSLLKNAKRTSQSDVEWLLLTGIPTKAITFTDTVIYLVPSVFQTTKKIKEVLRSMVYRDSA